MFRRLTDARRPAVTILINGVATQAQEGDSVAAALLAAGRVTCGTTAVSGAPRAPYCLMGVCFDCLVTVDGVGNRQGCLVPIREGMRIETGHGKRELEDSGSPLSGSPRKSPDTAVAEGWSRIGDFRGCPARGRAEEEFSAAHSRASGNPVSGPDPELRERYDVAVVGAGPAGLTAANLCARAGLDCVLFDEQASPGGQIYRAVTVSPLPRDTVLGRDYWRGAALARRALASGVHHVPAATVWGLLREGELAVSVAGGSRLVQARRVILAAGAIERPFPIPGWTLPGVMAAGGAQILLKSSGLVPQGRTVLAGCGPLLWLLAWQYLAAGVRVDAILDTTPRANWRRALRHVGEFAGSPYLAKGLRLILATRRKLRVIGGIVALEAHGKERIEAVTYRTARGREGRLPVDLLLLHQGVVPNVNLAMSAGVTHRWSEAQLCFVPVLDEYGATNVPGLAIAGDAGGIAGAEAAEARGWLAAVAAVRSLRPEASLGAEEATARAALRRFQGGRAFLDQLYRPAAQFRQPRRATLVCRCEEVSAGAIAETIALGCPGPNQMKAFLRCGMGPCQGRLCGLTVTELMGEARGVSAEAIGYYRLRPPVKPITLAELAGLPTSETAVKAVARE
jgi:thioredoxin reductase